MSCGMLIRRADEIVAFSSAADLMQGCFGSGLPSAETALPRAKTFLVALCLRLE